MRDYFNPNAIYTEKHFCRRFCMHKSLFLTIAKAVEKHDDWFKLRRSASSEISASPTMKCLVAVRVLAYGCSADAIDDYVLIGSPLFFGMPGSHNDLNVLSRTPLSSRLVAGNAPPVSYEVNGHEYTMGYYLADGIYPPWATFVKTIPKTLINNPKKAHFAKVQESARKDVECAFGVLQKRFGIIKGAVEYWKPKVLWQIMKCCIILHNMIIEDERGMPENFRYISNGDLVEPAHDPNRMQAFLQAHMRIENKQVHQQLQLDLVEHHWALHGAN
jgi:hypothetical protein